MQEAYAELLRIWENREPVTIRTSLGVFKDMIITKLDGCTATFQQITIVGEKL